MNIYTASLFTLTLAITSLLGCGSIVPAVANQTSVDSLSALMSSNPELARANLLQIKDAALGKNSSSSKVHAALSLQTTKKNAKPEKPEPEDLQLDSSVAKKAQELIEDSIKNFDFMALYDASIKTAGIHLNMQNAMIEQMKSFDDSMANKKGSPSKMGGKGGPDDKFAGDFNKGGMTCEEFLKNPMVDYGRDELDAMIAENKAEMLDDLSGCPEIKGGEFAKCMNDLNRYMSLINEHASCSVKHMRELKSIIKDKTGVNIESLEVDINRCMKKQFKTCGYEGKEAPNKKGESQDKPAQEGRLGGEDQE